MKKITGAEVPELSVSIEDNDYDDDDSVGSFGDTTIEMTGADVPELSISIEDDVDSIGSFGDTTLEIIGDEVPEFSVSIEDNYDIDDDSGGEAKSNIPDQVNGEEIPTVEIPDSGDGRCTNLSCLLNTVLDNIQEIVA